RRGKRNSIVALNEPAAIRLPQPLHHKLAMLLADGLAGKRESLEVRSPEHCHPFPDLDGVGNRSGRIDPHTREGGHEGSDGIPALDWVDAGLEKKSRWVE